MTSTPLLFSRPAHRALGFPLSRAPAGFPPACDSSPLGGALGASPLRVRWRPVGRWRSGGAVSAPPRANKPAGAGCYYCGSVAEVCKGSTSASALAIFCYLYCSDRHLSAPEKCAKNIHFAQLSELQKISVSDNWTCRLYSLYKHLLIPETSAPPQNVLFAQLLYAYMVSGYVLLDNNVNRGYNLPRW